MVVLREGKVEFDIQTGKISKKLPVFYNPVMEFNRSMSRLVLDAWDRKEVSVALPLCGSGIRGVRFLAELDKEKIRQVYFNDASLDAVQKAEEMLSRNRITDRFSVSNMDANIFMLKEKGFDYIDIDPFGSPNPFLNNAIVRLSRGGILGVTLTDAGSLCGSFPKACKRNYWAVPFRNEFCHETGLRILIRKVQLVGSQFDKALYPIFSYFKDHYFRVFFRCEKGAKRCDELITEHKKITVNDEDVGPLWVGELFDKGFVERMIEKNEDDSLSGFLEIVREESMIDQVGFYDIHALAKRHGTRVVKTDYLIGLLKDKGFLAGRTHLSSVGVKSNISLKEIVKELT